MCYTICSTPNLIDLLHSFTLTLLNENMYYYFKGKHAINPNLCFSNRQMNAKSGLYNYTIVVGSYVCTMDTCFQLYIS